MTPQNFNSINHSYGFTLIELIVVMVIMCIIAGFSAYSTISTQDLVGLRLGKDDLISKIKYARSYAKYTKSSVCANLDATNNSITFMTVRQDSDNANNVPNCDAGQALVSSIGNEPLIYKSPEGSDLLPKFKDTPITEFYILATGRFNNIDSITLKNDQEERTITLSPSTGWVGQSS